MILTQIVNVLLIFHLGNNYRDCVVDSGNVTKLTVCKSYVKHVLYTSHSINRYGVPEASAHHGNAKINLCTNFTTMVCMFEK